MGLLDLSMVRETNFNERHRFHQDPNMKDTLAILNKMA
jgi:hypothetical protein